MKFTGISLIVMGVMLFLLGCGQYTQSGPPTGELAWGFSLNPIITFVVAAGSVIAGTLIVRYGGRGYSWQRPAAQPPVVGPPAD